MQRATGPRLLRDHLRPARPEPGSLDSKSSTLTTRLKCKLVRTSDSKITGCEFDLTPAVRYWVSIWMGDRLLADKSS